MRVWHLLIVLGIAIALGITSIFVHPFRIQPAFNGVCMTPAGAQSFTNAKASWENGHLHLVLQDGSVVDTNAVCVAVEK